MAEEKATAQRMAEEKAAAAARVCRRDVDIVQKGE
jgi:hypothetical protein